ncbi:MAG: hypothetical protein AAGK98_09445 [Pseudomonadota bacterium]
MRRLIGSLTRAFLVLIVVAAPAFLLPTTTRTGQEVSLIIGGLIAAFTMFEYASSHPGLVDFRFAPPYNRIRFLSFALLIFALVFVCRATVGADPFSDDVLAVADRVVALTSLPLTPANIAFNMVGAGGDPEFGLLIHRAAAVSATISIGALVFFTLYIWIFRWPTERENFNLWVNLPTFDPTSNKDVAWRLRRGGLVNVMVGLSLPYAILTVVSRSGGWFDPSALQNHQSLVWGCVFWVFLPSVLFIRGTAMLKIAWLINRAQDS